MATAGTLTVNLEARSEKLLRHFDRAERRTKQFNRTAKQLGGALAGYFTGRALLRGIQGITQAFAKQEQAVVSLRAALQVTGQAGGDSLDRLTRKAAELQRVTTAADEELIAATATLAQLAPALRPSELERAQEAIIGIADTFLKGDVNNAALLLGKSIGSTTNALTRYGIQVDTTAGQGDKLNQILQQSAGFFEVSKEKADSLAGSIQQLANAWGDVKEAAGGVLAQRLGLTGLLQDWVNILEQLSGVDHVREAQLASLRNLGPAASQIALDQRLRRRVTLGARLGLAQRQGGIGSERVAAELAHEINRLTEEIGILRQQIKPEAPPVIQGRRYPVGPSARALMLGGLPLGEHVVGAAFARGRAGLTGRLAAPLLGPKPARPKDLGGFPVREAAKEFDYAAMITVRSLGDMAEAAVRGSADMEQAVVRAMAEIAAAAAASRFGPIAGTAVAAFGGIVSAFTADKPRPVSIDSFSDMAQNQLRDSQGPVRITLGSGFDPSNPWELERLATLIEGLKGREVVVSGL